MKTSLESAVTNAKKMLMEYWPLPAFIATNPLWGLRDQDFFEVVSHPKFNGLMPIDYYLSQYESQTISDTDLLEAIKSLENKALSKSELQQWIQQSKQNSKSEEAKVLYSQQVDEYQFQYPPTWIKQQIFTALRDYFGQGHYRHTDLLSFWMQQNSIKNKPSIAEIIAKLNIADTVLLDYLQAIYCEVYGWASFMNWRNLHPNNPWIPGSDACEIILQIWLYYEQKIYLSTKLAYKNCDSLYSVADQQAGMRKRYIWQTAFELNTNKQLESLIHVPVRETDTAYQAQFIFCIDTRSEGIRRHIESQGKYQTFGFAGFFGAIFKLDDNGSVCYQSPALVDPSTTLSLKTETQKLESLKNNFKKIVQFSKKQITTAFALFEILGFWFAFFMLFKVIQPKLKIKQQASAIDVTDNLSDEAQFQAAHTLLTSIGLVDNFSHWVFICSHQSDNINNPFKSSLNCGACGGNSGIPNAIVVSKILNRQAIRNQLKQVGISIPEHTRFIPACHHTGHDRLEIFDGEVPQEIQNHITQATDELILEKSRCLPGHNTLSEREQSWSELIPELGLLNNTAIIIGPRELTLNQNLQRQVFLHSYKPELDQKGEILTAILSAPAIVAHWINSQYYFSTVNPSLFAAGNKALHNIIPGIGVIEGNLSDLKIGLPQQSTHFQAKPMHQPKRIIVIVYARKKILDSAIANSPDFKVLLDNRWIHLKHIEAD